MISPDEVVSRALQRVQRVDPTKSEVVAAWFRKNLAFLTVIATAILAQFRRIGDAISQRSPTAIVESLIRGLTARNHPLAERATKFADLLRVIVEASIAGLAEKSEVSREPDTPYPLILPRQPSERLLTNAEAIRIASRGMTPSREERSILLRYTGNGGLSLEKLAELVPADWLPTSKALVDEYYTLPELCAAAAAVVASWVGPEGLSGPALEPSCGIGRFIGAFMSRPDMRGLQWTGVEYSKISAKICELLYTSAKIVNVPFESWIADNYNEVAGTFGLVVTNPPYGKRGGNKTLDPDKYYREDVAYAYMVRRSFDLLRPGGYGIALVPQGFLSGSQPQARRLRERLLLRHHLLCAFRLPSDLYPGAEIVTDISFWQSRGGELSELLPEDIAIADGAYFAQYPEAVLGVEQFSARGRYQVLGEFRGLPQPRIRSRCESCGVTPYNRPIERKVSPEELLSPELLGVHQIGMRLERYLALVASNDSQKTETAASLHDELVDALNSWLSAQRARFGQYNPRQDTELAKAANNLPSLAAVLAVVEPDGSLAASLQTKPVYYSPYVGPDTVAAHADWLYAKSRKLTITELDRFRVGMGLQSETETVLSTALQAQNWCFDGENGWVPQADYYSGDLWPKIERAKADGGSLATVQLARLLERVGTVTLEDAAPAPREAWIPTAIIQDFLAHWLNQEVPQLHWYRAVLKPKGILYSELGKLEIGLQTALGYINHDFSWFAPDYKKQTDPDTGEEESAEAALDRVRVAYHGKITEAFSTWLRQQPEHQEAILETYRRTFRGYVVPDYPADPLPIARWGKKITPKPHQLAGAWRMIKSNGGLCAYDVGVGKTLTGCATIAYLRQIGRARRPLVIVPNTIIWKWHREITRALPDYRIGVIGSVRYLGRGGVYKSRLDERAERLAKWSEFQLGLYDVVLCTYSVFANTRITEESLRQFLEETPSLLRAIGLKTANLEKELEKLDKIYNRRDELAAHIKRLRDELEGTAPPPEGLVGQDDGDDNDDEDDDERDEG